MRLADVRYVVAGLALLAIVTIMGGPRGLVGVLTMLAACVSIGYGVWGFVLVPRVDAER